MHHYLQQKWALRLFQNGTDYTFLQRNLNDRAPRKGGEAHLGGRKPHRRLLTNAGSANIEFHPQ